MGWDDCYKRFSWSIPEKNVRVKKYNDYVFCTYYSM